MIHDSSGYTTLYPSTHLLKSRVSDPHRFSPPVLYSLISHSFHYKHDELVYYLAPQTIIQSLYTLRHSRVITDTT